MKVQRERQWPHYWSEEERGEFAGHIAANPTATLLTAPYARRGVTVVGGTRVVEPDALLDMLAEGGSGYHLFGKTIERVTLRLTPAA